MDAYRLIKRTFEKDEILPEIKETFENITGDGLTSSEIEAGEITPQTLEIGIELEADDLCPEGADDYYVETIETNDGDTFYRCESCGEYYSYYETCAECCGSYSSDPDELYLPTTTFDYEWKSDGSLNDGAELILSDPIPFKDIDTAFNEMREIMDSQDNSPYYSRSCGLHIHISDSELNLKTNLNKVLVDYIYNNLIDGIVKSELHTRSTQYAELGTNLRGGDRYYEINFRKSGTVELRLFDASIIDCPDLLKACKKLIICIYQNINLLRRALKNPSDNLITLYQLVKPHTEQEQQNTHQKTATALLHLKQFLRKDLSHNTNNSLRFLELYGVDEIETLLKFAKWCENYYYNFNKGYRLYGQYKDYIQGQFKYSILQYEKINSIIKDY